MSWKRAISLSLLLAVALAVAGCGNSSPSTPSATYQFYKMTTGAVRVYHTESSEEPPSDETWTVMGTETFSGETCVKMRLVEDSGGAPTTTYRYFKEVADGVALVGSSSEEEGEFVLPTAMVYPTLEPGEIFTQAPYTWTAQAVESVTVPAGTFSALKITGVSGPDTLTMWIAPNGVGIVKMVSDIDTMTLQSYSD